MVQRYDTEAIVANVRANMDAMGAKAVRPAAKSAYRANNVYVEFMRWSANESNRLTAGEDATRVFTAASLVIAQQMLGVANLITSREMAPEAVNFMLAEVADLVTAALSGKVKSRPVETPLVEIGDA